MEKIKAQFLNSEMIQVVIQTVVQSNTECKGWI